MRIRTPFVLPLAASLGVAAMLAFAAPPGGGERPRVIVLGFDGVDHGLAQRFLAEGHLPNLAKLAEQGSFTRLETTNPAESAVSWSTFGRGLNPGKTSLFGFVCRKPGTYLPDVRFMRLGEVPLEEVYGPEDRPSGAPAWGAVGGAGAAGLVVGLLLAVILRARGAARALLVLAGAGGGCWLGWALTQGQGASTPSKVPTLLPVLEGDAVWHRLDAAGIRVKGVLAPMAAPVEPLEHGKLVGGLGVPDVAGRAIGSFTLFSTSREDVPVGTRRSTDSAGEVVLLTERDGAFVGELEGPQDLAARDSVQASLEAVDAELAAPELAADRRAELTRERGELQRQLADGFATHLEVRVRRLDGERLEVSIGDHTVVAAAGEWSDYLPIRFPLPWPLDARALARFRVVSAGDDIRVFFSALGYDPRDIPEHMHIEQPPGFSAQIAADAGLYDSTGWACMSNPLKDAVIDEEVFLEQLKQLTKERAAVLYSELAKDDYDFYFMLFGETDRISHMMYRLLDEQNPMHDPELAARYGSAILDSYIAMDNIVGEVMRRFVDERTHLMVLSDHGFTSFRRQMSLNTWLLEEGYLVPKRAATSAKQLLARLPRHEQDYLLYMDPKRSRAFAMGLGKIYINRRGREVHGIVGDEEYEALCAEITEKLLALRDPKTGSQAVRRVWRGDELYQGPHAGSDADLYLGFAEHYRVSWSTTVGGLSAEVFEDNDSNWSGDHASNDPEVVPGVLFSSRPLAAGQRPAIVDMAPTILTLFGLPAGETDGAALQFE